MIDATSLERLAGLPVVGTGDEPLGRVDAVYEAEGGGGTFATVRPSGGRAVFFPLRDAVLRGDEVVVPYTGAFVQSAPTVEDAEELSAQDQQRLLAHYATKPAAQASGAEAGMVLSEERLHVGTERVAAGRAVLRKHIVTETESRTIPLRHEEVRIEREPIDAADAPAGGLQLSEEVHEIVLTGEQPVVEREVVPVERVRLATHDVVEQVEIAEEVRKERIDVDEVAGGDRRDDDTEVRSEIVFEPRRDEQVVDVRDEAAETRTEIVFEPRH